MTQVEIAKKILGQGNCIGIICANNCPFYRNCGCEHHNRHSNEFKTKVKQWIKEQEKEMIDLTVNQIVNPPVKCWVRNYDRFWKEDLLYSIDHRDKNAYPFRSRRSCFTYCTLTDPTKPKFKPWLTVEDVPQELWCKVLCRKRSEEIFRATILEPNQITDYKGKLQDNMIYLPLGQPLTGEWLEMGEWV